MLSVWTFCFLDLLFLWGLEGRVLSVWIGEGHIREQSRGCSREQACKEAEEVWGLVK